MALTTEDVRLWTTLVNAAFPLVGAGVQGVLSIIRLFRRTQGQPEDQLGDELLAAEVMQAISKAQKPWVTVGDIADGELDRVKDRLRREGK